MLAPEDHERARNNFKLALKNNYDSFEYTGLRKDGTTFPIKIFTSPIIIDNKIQGLRGIILDITKEKQIQNSSKENEERFYSLFEHMGCCCIILKAINDFEDFIVIDINREAEIFSEIKEDARGKSLKNVLLKLKSSDIFNVIKRVGITGKEEKYPYFEYKDNKLLFWIDCQVFKLPSGELALVYKNITDGKKIKESLKENETKYKSLFDCNPCYMVLLETNGVVSDINKSMLNLMGLAKEEIVGSHFMDLNVLFEEDKSVYIENFNKILKEPETQDTIIIRLIDKVGDLHWVKNYLSTIDFKDEVMYVLVINDDINQQKIYDDKLRNALKEKDNLLKEIHHRVKNNMQIISSLLNLQKSFVEEEEAINILLESQNRVQSMALIHEKLYSSANLTKIHIKSYINNLVSNLLFSYNIKDSLIQDFDVENIVLGIETAIPLGLIITELVSNSIKYAFNEENRNELYIGLKYQNPTYELIIKDNGPGMSSNFILDDCKTLGLILVNNLVNQLEGNMSINCEKGTEFNIIFNELDYPPRI
jgi:PAS domain S-box-containing protein